MKRIGTLFVAILIAFGIPNLAITQDFDHYQPLKCTGDVPDDFLIPASKKYRDNLALKGGNPTDANYEALNKFFLNTSFFQQELKKSGLVLFNDPITKYLNRVKDELLKDDPELKQKVRIYTMRTAIPNAFATEDGTIVVGMGLLERLETEAQLAFILCHEIQHVVYGHSLDQHLKTVDLESEIDAKNNVSRRMQQLEMQFKRSSYSREHEMEADRGGLELFLKSDYAINAPLEVFEILRVCYLPYAERPFDPTFYVGKGVELPKDMVLEKVNEINPDKFNDFDSLSATHPSLDARLSIAEKIIAESGKTEGTPFMVSPEDFLLCRKMARYEITFNLLLDSRYSRALYYAYLGLEDEPESAYLQKCAAQSLYGFAKYANRGKKNALQDSSFYYQGQFQSMIHFTQSLHPDLASLVAAEWLMKAMEKNPNDRELKEMLDDMVREFLERDGMLWKKEFPKITPQMSKREAAKLKKEYEGPTNTFAWKYDNCAIKTKWEPDREIVLAKLSALEANPYFKHLLDSTQTAIQQSSYIQKESQYAIASTVRPTKKVIKNLLVVNPIYRVVPLKRKPVGNELVESEELTIEFANQIKAEAKKNGIEADVLTLYNLEKGDGEVIEDVYVIKRGVYEYATGLGWKFVSPLGDELKEVLDKYGHQYLDFTTIVREKTYSTTNRQIGTCLTYSIIGYPIGLAVALSKAWTRTVHSLVLDTQNMDVVFTEKEQYNDKTEKKAKDNLSHKYRKMAGNSR